jgi:WD40 repeat protein
LACDGKRILSGDYDNNMIIWDSKTGHNIKTLYDNTYSINSVWLSSDGSRIVSGNYDNTIKIWNA